MTHNDFTYKELLRESFELTKKHFLFLFGLLMINLVLGMITAEIPIVGQLIGIALSIASTCIALLIVGGHTPVYKDMLRPFKTYLTFWHYFLAAITVFFLFAVAGIIFLGIGGGISAVSSNYIAFGAAGLIFLLVAVYYGTRLSFFRFFIVEDENVGPIDALKKSMSITENRFWKILGFIGILILLNLAGLIAFVIGLAFTIPMTWLAITLLYKRLSNTHPIHKHHEGRHIASE